MLIDRPKTTTISIESLQNAAKNAGFTYDYQPSSIEKNTNGHQFISGKVLGQDFKIDAESVAEAVTAIRVLDGLNQHEAKINALTDGQEVVIATVNKIQNHEEYVDQTYGHKDYVVINENGQLVMKVYSHAASWVSSNDDQPMTSTLDQFISSWQY